MRCNNSIQCVAIHFFLSALVFSLGKCANFNLTSPCPRLFTYENNTEADDRWYGAITLLNDYDLNGVWLRVVFDKPVGHVKSMFGEVVPREGNEYLIKDRNFTLVGNIPYTVRFYIQYGFDETPANLVGFRLNGKVLCPEVDISKTTTERLFTSWKKDVHVPEDLEDMNVPGTNDKHEAIYVSPIQITSSDVNVVINTTFTANNFTNEVEPNYTEEVGTLYVSN